MNLVIKFSRDVLLNSLEVFPAEGSDGYKVDRVSVSDDGKSWTGLPVSPKGSNGTAFPETKVLWLKLKSGLGNQGIRELVFYGK